MERTRATSPRRPLCAPWWRSIAFALIFVACDGSGDLPLDQVDPDAVPANPTYDQVYAILQNNCTTCHSNGDDDDYATLHTRAATASTEPDLADCAEIVSFRFSVLEQIEGNTMPPGAMPRLTNEQKLLIRRWVDNGAPAPCN